MRLDGDLIGEVDERGEAIVGDTILLLLNTSIARPFPSRCRRRERGNCGNVCLIPRTPRACLWRALVGMHTSFRAVPWPSYRSRHSTKKRYNSWVWAGRKPLRTHVTGVWHGTPGGRDNWHLPGHAAVVLRPDTRQERGNSHRGRGKSHTGPEPDFLVALEQALVAATFPESTYRVQFHAGFTFRDALHIVPYLHDLGITHLYASPLLQARPGSTHGYDITNHQTFNPELGTAE